MRAELYAEIGAMKRGFNLDRRRRGWLLYALACWLAFPMASFAATNSASLPVVPKYSRFDKSFTSTVAYGNPPADATLAVTFISPQGDTTKVPGFWDGGRTWRVRFSPDLAGKWSFKTACSDATNSGLNNVSGQFLCTAAVGKSRFELHGPLRVAMDRRHLEHEDKTPFFWLADTVWDGARRSKSTDWDYYVQVRASQRFSVAQWSAAPGVDSKNQTAWTGDKHIFINPAFFAQLDSKIEKLERVGMLSAIVPLRDFAPPGTNSFEALPEDQAALLLRYMVARWGAYNVVWVLSCEGEGPGGKINRWKRIGREVFDGVRTPVMLYAGDTYWALEEFRNEPWLDMFGYQSGREINDDSIQWLVAGPVSTDWEKEPPRPIINLAVPYENEPVGRPASRPAAQAVRRAAYWSLLNAPPAGVTYGGYSVWNWQTDKPKGADLPRWRTALFMPAAKQMGTLAGFFSSMEFWRLRPAQDMLVRQPGSETPARHIAAARTESRDLAVVYVPEDRRVALSVAAMPAAPDSYWINPRTGERAPASAVASGGGACEFETPAEGDWLLVLKSEKK